MGKRIIQQARGKGGPTYKSPSFRYKADIKYLNKETNGEIIDIIKCQGHSAPLLKIRYNDKTTGFMIAPEEVKVGDEITIKEDAPLKNGNTLTLKNVPLGTSIYNIEKVPGDGGKFVRTTGAFAKVIGHTKNKIIVELPSKKQKEFHPECRATIGIVAGSGRKEKPFLKAGKRYYAMKAKNKLYPRSGGTSMNAVDHPFGGTTSSHKGKPTIAPKNAPPGRKVGKVRPKRTGRKKR